MELPTMALGQSVGTPAFSLRLHKTVPAQPEKGYVPALYFEIVAQGIPVGQCVLRLGDSELLQYAGHLGYEVQPQHRGRHYALRACWLLVGLARRYGLSKVYLTCEPDNIASRKTCEALGAQLVQKLEVPHNHDLYTRGRTELLQYRLQMTGSILPAIEQDLPAIAALYDRVTAREAQGTNYSGWEAGEYPMEWTARELYEAGGLYCILDGKGRVIASAGFDNRHEDCYDRVNWRSDLPSAQTLCIHTLAIDPDCRGQGLGERLMRFGFAKAEELGLCGIRIDTWTQNLPALNLYHKLGYTDAQVLSDDVHFEGDTMAYQFLEWYPKEEG